VKALLNRTYPALSTAVCLILAGLALTACTIEAAQLPPTTITAQPGDAPPPTATALPPTAVPPSTLTPTLAEPPATVEAQAVAAEPRRAQTWGEGVPVALALGPGKTDLYIATTRRLQQRDARDLKALRWDQPLEGSPAALALAPDGTTLALASATQVELRNAADGLPRASLSHSAEVQALAFAPDGTLLAAALSSEVVVVWDLASRTPLRELRRQEGRDPMALPSPLTSLSFAPDGERLVSGDQNGNVTIWQLHDGTVLHSLSVGWRSVSDVAFSPDGTIVGAASEGGRSEAGAIWLWHAVSGAELARLTVDDDQRMLEPVLRLAFAADGAAVVAGTASGNLLRWAWPSGALERETQAHRAAISAMALTPGGGVISAGRDGALRRWSGDGFVIDEYGGLPAISAVAAGSKYLAMGGEDGRLTIWTPSESPAAGFAAHQGPVNALVANPAGSLLASASNDGLVRLWSMPGGAPRGELVGHEGPVLALAFSPNGKHLASAGWDGTLRLWSMPEGTLLETFTIIEHDGLSATSVLALSFDDAGTSLVGTAYDGKARRFAVADGTPLPTLRTRAGGWLIALTYTLDGAVAALDDTGLLWAWQPDGSLIGRGALADATALAALADGRLLTVGPVGGLRLWSLDDDGPIELRAAPCDGDSLAISPDNRHALVGSRRGFVELWVLP
jgi:WD40 repeat protein